MTTPTDNKLLASALWYAVHGWNVFPCKPKGKEPLTTHGLLDATANEATIRDWWQRWPHANIGIATGAKSGIVVLDVDTRHGGDESLAALEAEHGKLPATIECLTGGGGRHIYFNHPGRAVKNATALGGYQGLDVRGDGGYVLAPPSKHKSGNRYTWELSSRPDTTPLAELPPWLLAWMRTQTAGPNGYKAEPIGDKIPKGQQHYTLVRIAGAMRHHGASGEAIDAALQIINEKQLEEPAPPEHMTKIAQSIERLYDSAPRFFALTDYGNAERLVAGHGDDLRYCHVWGRWLVWDGCRWNVDATAEVERRAKQTVRMIYHEAAEATDENVRKAIAEWAKKSESRQRIDAMIDLAQSEPGIPVQPNELDADPWLLNIQNGTTDLRSGELHEHRREDLTTKLAPVVLEPNAQGERWQKRIEMFLPNGNVRRHVQRDLGRALVGTTLDESISIWHGGGANGKTTTARALIRTLGDYADRAAPDLLIACKNERHPTEVADLCGKRLIFSVEVDQGKHLAEALVKDLTGGDRKKARFMHQDFFAFEQTFSITLIVNHKPIVTGADEGIWRRIRLIPWEYRIPDDQKRPQDEVLSELVAEGPAILHWLLAGLRDWQQDHSWIADEVKAANEAYRAEMDVLGDFIAECCILGPRCTVPKAALYSTYESWCEKTGEKGITKRVFTQRLAGRGIGEDRTGHDRTRTYRGIGLRTDADTSSVTFHMRDVSEKQPEQVSASVRIIEDTCLACNAEVYAYAPDGKGYCEQHLAGSGRSDRQALEAL